MDTSFSRGCAGADNRVCAGAKAAAGRAEPPATEVRSKMEKQPGEVSVLYVDDESSTRELMARMLRWKGLAVKTAGDGRTALQMVAHHRPDIIVTDIMMPDMDGISMSREVRKISSEIPIIIVSAFLHEQYLADLRNLGISHFIMKPVRMDRLFGSIETCCRDAGILTAPILA